MDIQPPMQKFGVKMLALPAIAIYSACTYQVFIPDFSLLFKPMGIYRYSTAGVLGDWLNLKHALKRIPVIVEMCIREPLSWLWKWLSL